MTILGLRFQVFDFPGPFFHLAIDPQPNIEPPAEPVKTAGSGCTKSPSVFCAFDRSWSEAVGLGNSRFISVSCWGFVCNFLFRSHCLISPPEDPSLWTPLFPLSFMGFLWLLCVSSGKITLYRPRVFHNLLFLFIISRNFRNELLKSSSYSKRQTEYLR